MIEFFVVETENDYAGNAASMINVKYGDGSFKSFPADNSNPEFISFLRELEKTNDPYFTAWVEAGNDPDEFWTQTEDSLMIEPKEGEI